MGTPLISQSQKTTIQNIIDDIHETFARNITVFEEGKKVLISASNEFNGIYGRAGDGEKTTTRTVVSHTMKARIKYRRKGKKPIRWQYTKPIRHRAS